MIPWIIGGVSIILTIVCTGLGFWLVARTSASNSTSSTSNHGEPETIAKKTADPWKTPVRVVVALTITSLVLGGVGICGVALMGIGEAKGLEKAGVTPHNQTVSLPSNGDWVGPFEGYNTVRPVGGPVAIKAALDNGELIIWIDYPGVVSEPEALQGRYAKRLWFRTVSENEKPPNISSGKEVRLERY